MSEDKKTQSDETEQEAADAAAEAAVEEAGADVETAPEDSDEVVQLKSELAAMRDRALRAVAEAENVRRRADKERSDTLKYAASGLAKELLPVVDNLRRAVEAVPEEHRADNEVMKNLLVGVEMTEKMLLDAFQKNHIAKIDPLDEKFNYAEHQAIQEVPGTGKPAGTVVQVLQSGYKLHDRLLRPAMVLVAKGDAAPPPDDTEKVDTSA
ncbi:MAG: nucleotide exchange factor GrpE [Alphaproteobacteria bacterium]|uniref:nucleotide exchange factor GrpE n=1 Tax=Pacificispira sp. TaxID=2888761 RepID=UPI001AFEA284|nr:nucleotide exchange factor GrpE [Alphaproteobacteria bacterium]MBO6861326.1 nucleotide exchange factor GrpE [Alphaproteobacteria bacterium]MEC9268598.1 nucleotide exchange factor GrpE [Pseudomonadota bacterium]